MSKYVGSGNSILCDARRFALDSFDAVWASPPCQKLSRAANQKGQTVKGEYKEDLLDWCFHIKAPVLWIENVPSYYNDWGTMYNAAQFTNPPLQNRLRVIGGRHKEPKVLHSFKFKFEGICGTITATEHKAGGTDPRRAARYYGRLLTIEECAYHQGFTIPWEWYNCFTKKQIYEAIGNGVPVYMAKAFGDCYA